MPERKFVVGCGYLGRRVAACWAEQGHEVHVTTRTAERVRVLQQDGFNAHVLDVTRPDTFFDIGPVATLLYSVSYDRQAAASREDVSQRGLAAFLTTHTPVVDRLVFTSSTGVYGQMAGEWVDEDAECRPKSEGGRNCLAAEQILRSNPLAKRVIILRLAGLYGPDRVPMLEYARRRQPIPAAPGGYLNLIHVDDAVAAILAAERANPPLIYNVADGHPVVREDYYREVARYSGVEPVFGQPNQDSQRAERAKSNKRVRSDRIATELDLRWRYPDYRVGLAMTLANRDGG